MAQDVMLHVSEILDSEARRSLLAYLDEQLGIGAAALNSSKPHLLFFPAGISKAPPHAVLEAVRRKGYHARLVDL